MDKQRNEITDKQGLGERIKHMREYHQFTIEEAAELSDSSVSIWRQYERGERLPSIQKLKSICLTLKVKPEYLFGPELNELQEHLSEIEQLKLKLEQLTPEDISVIHAAVTKRLEFS